MVEAATITAISAIIGAGTAAYSAYQQFEAADKAEEIAKKEDDLAKLETEEQARRLEKRQARAAGLLRAQAAASGLDPDSTTLELYEQEFLSTQQEELDWLRRTGYRRAENIREQGEFAKASGQQAGFGSIGQMFSYAPDIYEGGRKAKWWS